MTEAMLQACVVETARLLGWRVHHTRPARTGKGWRTPIMGDVGFPDLVLARDGRVLFAELKQNGKRPRAEQQAWLDVLPDAVVWCPTDWESGRIEQVLRAPPLTP